ncbi:hypothetical protein Patl1_28653 [Pistacia atlantica]|uniref:Uncharacterized protein n=1 Tax=Pistacia atlantica TaxID=434234 RepID=A0ACC1BET5_9ROSI|nr:hypothetical protein Patl1_28653 [Pistacia atlantica]
MASKASPSASASKSEPLKESSMTKSQDKTTSHKEILSVIDSLKKQLAADHCVSIKRRVEENRQKLAGITNHIYRLSLERGNHLISNITNSVDLLARRQRDAFGVQSGIDASDGDRDSHSSQDDGHASTAIQGIY